MQALVRSKSAAEETRTRILAAAKAIYEANGTRGTTTREVAERAGVNEATIFRHFGNKGALLAAMREWAGDIAQLNIVLDSLSGDVESDLHVLANASIERLFRQRSMMCIQMAEETRGEFSPGENGSPEWRAPSHILGRVREYFSELVSRGVLRGDPDLHTRAFMSLCFSYVIARKLWETDVAKACDVDYLVDLFLNGVKN
jgi:AcrR family transcriptional regulator